jgi:hypothetical protein
MPLCHCQFAGELSSTEHRTHHRSWEERQSSPPVSAVSTAIEVTDIYRTLDEIIAALHGGPLPRLTAGAQAIMTNARRTT